MRIGLQTLRGAVLVFAAATAPFAEAEELSRYLGPEMPYAAFGELPKSAVTMGLGTIEVGIVPEPARRRREAIMTWVTDSTRALTTYFGRWPVERLQLLVVEVPGREIHGTTWGYRGAATRILLGADAHADEVTDSWVLTHEMVHAALPGLPRQQLWLEEGLATYIEPLARAQAGLVSAEYVWGQFLWGMPHGLPQAGDRGLDHTHTWGRTYWGGALFCLLADLEIRERTGGWRSLQDVLRAVVATGANNEVDWSVERLAAVAEAATGVPVLRELYERHSAGPVEVDLPALWRRVGVAASRGKITFDDRAPAAGERRALTRPPATDCSGADLRNGQTTTTPNGVCDVHQATQ